MIRMASYLAGDEIGTGSELFVHHPFDGSLVGSVHGIDRRGVDLAVEKARAFRSPPTRHERRALLERAAATLDTEREEFASLITRESGLALQDTRYEVQRAIEVLRAAAVVALDDEGHSWPCDVSPRARARRVYAQREPLAVVGAITPFNHPLNQVAHKVAPAIAAGTPIILKPSEKTPLTALRFGKLLYEAGLPGPMLSVLCGSIDEVAEPLVAHQGLEALSFTGSLHIGKLITQRAGYKKLALELGGNSPLIVMDDADLELAAVLAAEGSFRNSGQRCTAVKRILVQRSVKDAFLSAFLARVEDYPAGDPVHPYTRVGTVIDEAAAIKLERFVQDAVAKGARVVAGAPRQGALLPPTVIDNVPFHARMWREEAFGPLAPIYTFEDLDEAIALANDSDYGLATAVVTNRLDRAFAVIKGVRTGTVNVNEVPGFRLESTPFGGLKGSGIGVKEGVVEAARFFSFTKVFSLPY